MSLSAPEKAALEAAVKQLKADPALAQGPDFASLRALLTTSAPTKEPEKQAEKEEEEDDVSASRVSSVLDFLSIVGRLKETKRTGWVRSGVKGAESVADHMYRMALMCFAMGPAEGIDREKCIKMALVHDLGESLIGDLVVEGESGKRDKITRAEKAKKEQEAMERICGTLGGAAGREMLQLWHEFEDGETRDSKYLKDLDKFEMVLQATEYEEAQSRDLPDFFRTTQGKFVTGLFKALDAEVRRRRQSRKAEHEESAEQPPAKKAKAD